MSSLNTVDFLAPFFNNFTVGKLYPHFRDESLVTITQKAKEILEKTGKIILHAIEAGTLIGMPAGAIVLSLESFSAAHLFSGIFFGGIVGATGCGAFTIACAIPAIALITIAWGVKKAWNRLFDIPGVHKKSETIPFENSSDHMINFTWNFLRTALLKEAEQMLEEIKENPLEEDYPLSYKNLSIDLRDLLKKALDLEEQQAQLEKALKELENIETLESQELSNKLKEVLKQLELTNPTLDQIQHYIQEQLDNIQRQQDSLLGQLNGSSTTELQNSTHEEQLTIYEEKIDEIKQQIETLARMQKEHDLSGFSYNMLPNFEERILQNGEGESSVVEDNLWKFITRWTVNETTFKKEMKKWLSEGRVYSSLNIVSKFIDSKENDPFHTLQNVSVSEVLFFQMLYVFLYTKEHNISKLAVIQRSVANSYRILRELNRAGYPCYHIMEKEVRNNELLKRYNQTFVGNLMYRLMQKCFPNYSQFISEEEFIPIPSDTKEYENIFTEMTEDSGERVSGYLSLKPVGSQKSNRFWKGVFQVTQDQCYLYWQTGLYQFDTKEAFSQWLIKHFPSFIYEGISFQTVSSVEEAKGQ